MAINQRGKSLVAFIIKGSFGVAHPALSSPRTAEMRSRRECSRRLDDPLTDIRHKKKSRRSVTPPAFAAIVRVAVTLRLFRGSGLRGLFSRAAWFDRLLRTIGLCRRGLFRGCLAGLRLARRTGLVSGRSWFGRVGRLRQRSGHEEASCHGRDDIGFCNGFHINSLIAGTAPGGCMHRSGQ
jgi:hypothetical protein